MSSSPFLGVHQQFARQARRTPEATALSTDGATLSYAELDGRANRLANRLLALGAGRGDLIGLRVPRSVDSVVAMLGVLKAGAAYVPLEAGLPDDRLRLMAVECGLKLVLTGGSLEWTVTGVETLRLDDPGIAAAPDTDPDVAVHPDDLCYVPYTSGSTGQPKGTEVAHRNLPGFFRDETYAYWGPGAVSAHHSALSWDGHVLDIYPVLLSGGRLAVFPGDASDPVAVVRWAATQGVTVLWLTAAAFNTVVNVDPRLLAGVRHLMIGGEVLSVSHVATALAALPDTRIVNGYGPSECTVFSCVREIGPADLTGAAVPIGRPVGDRRVVLLDEHGDAVADGATGELCVGGDAVSRGYLGRPALTAERFVPEPGGDGARLYRTGDFARRRADGVLEFVGRIDGQVKLRGFRIELAEVAAALRGHPSVVDAAAVVRADKLIGYVVTEADPEEIRAWLAGRLPAPMVPAALVALDTLPLTRNGKLDRAALPEPVPRGGGVAYEEPAGPTEGFLAEVWRELLDVPQVGRWHDFFRLGGHSLLATQVVSRIRARWGIELRVRDLYEAPRLADLAAVTERALAGGRGSTRTRIGRAARTVRAPASFAQHRLWLMEKLDPTASTYNIQFGLRFAGALDRAALRGALAETVRRHEVLRTAFEFDEDELLQVITPPAPVPVADLDLRDAADPEQALRAHADAELRRAFDLETGPLLRAHLVRLAETDHVLLITLDHLVCDAWSLRLLHDELTAHYAAYRAGTAPALPEPEIQYADFAAWQRDTLTGDELERQLGHWRRHLHEPPARLELPADRPRGAVPRGRGASDSAPLPAGVVAAAERLAAAEGTSLFTVLLTAFSVLLARYSGQPEHVIGTLVANRTRAEIEGLVGFFANTVALRMDAGGEPTFRALLAKTRDVVLDAYAHQEVPFERVVEELQPKREPDRQPFFDVMMQLADIDRPVVDLDGTRIEPVELASAPAPVDLILAVLKENGALVAVWDYDERLFDRDTIHRMRRHYLTLLRELVADPDTPVGAVPLVAGAERQQLLGWGRSGTAGGGTDPDPLARAAVLHPGRIALSGAESVEYGTLDARVNRLAHHLLALGVGPETPVGIALDGVPRVVAELAVLRCGGLVSIVDGEWPVRCHVVVTCAARAGAAGHGPAVVLVDRDDAVLAGWPAFAPRVSLEPDAGAVLLTELDRTGPVVLSYRALARLISFQRTEFALDPGAVVPLRGRAGSTSALFETLLALGCGGRLDVPAAGAAPAPDAAVVVLTAAEAAGGLPGGDLPAAARLVVLGDLEALAVARRLDEAGPRPVLGVYDVPAGAWCALRRGAGAGPPVGGVPFASGPVYVLDGWLNLVPPGVRGELCFGGETLARGLLGHPADTAARYLPDPFGAKGSRLYRTGMPARWTPPRVLELLDADAPGEADTPAGERTAPRGPVERLIGDVWCDVLRLDEVVIEDDFFDLGGHSLLASQIRTRLRREFDLDVPVRVLFENPVLGDFAAAVLDIADTVGKEDQ